MRTQIYFFSGTGNSLALARGLANRLGNCELINIRDTREAEEIRIDAKCFGIIFPVYAFGPPRIVASFIEKITACKASYVFLLSNCASMPGSALELSRHMLSEQGVEVSRMLNIRMPSNYLPFGGAESQEKQNAKFTLAETRLDELAGQISSSTPGGMQPPWLITRWIGRFSYRLFLGSLKNAARKFHVNEHCDGCGLCAKVCPVDNISAGNGRSPIWDDNCEQCMSCIQFCPRNAITMTGVPESRAHYHHPDIQASDLF